MENKKTMFANILDTETFGNDTSQYFFDNKKAKNKNNYLQITNLQQNGNQTSKRTHIILFEDDLEFFLEALTMLLSRHATGNHGISC
jgi:DNA repair protein RadC